jgi:copper chaperone CopZ
VTRDALHRRRGLPRRLVPGVHTPGVVSRDNQFRSLVMRLITSLIVSIGLLLAVSMGSCQKTESVSPGGDVSLSEMGAIEESSATLWVLGMGCPQCSNNVDEQLKKVQGVESAKVDLATGKVKVALAGTNRPTRQQLAQAITDSGFTLRKIEVP